MFAALTMDRITDDADWRDEHRLDCSAVLAMFNTEDGRKEVKEGKKERRIAALCLQWLGHENWETRRCTRIEGIARCAYNG